MAALDPQALTALLTEVYRFWFGELHAPDAVPGDRMKLWFEQNDATDTLIRTRFGDKLDTVAEARPLLADLPREACVGLVIMLDQFPRNLFRTDGRAFAYDARAREVARALTERNLTEYPLIERMFLFLPFEHSEAIADQHHSVLLYEQLAAAAPAEQKELYRHVLEYAVKHRDLIARFDRFPHRNAMLGRPSTPEETAFLAEHGRGY